MPVDSTHAEYDCFSPKWVRIRDVCAGSDEVKARRTQYLPQPSGLDDADYLDYITRAEFFPAATRTVDGLLGAIFRKDPFVEVPAGQDDLLDHLTIQGSDFTTFSKSVGQEVLTLGRYGVLVDVIDDDNLPFAAGYTAENIINWQIAHIEREPVLTMVVLREFRQAPKADDPFVIETRRRWRVLQLGILDDQSPDITPVYIQTLFEEVKNEKGGDQIVQIGQVVPLRRGEPLNKIPFIFFGPTNLTPDIEKPPILDLVDTNLSHYRTSAELEEGAFFTGQPMYVISGRGIGEETPGVFKVGSRSALRLDEGGSAKVLTVSGEGMGILIKLMESKEQHMAILGARILEDQKAGVEAAATMAMRHRGENSLLGCLADTIGRGMSRVLEIMIWWNGVDDPDVTSEFNKDFTSLKLTGAEIVQLVSAFQSGAVGPEVFFKALKDGERIPDGWTMDDWLADIEKGADTFTRGLTNEDIDEEDEEDSDDG
jgi:hypothetical protein